MAAQAKCDYSDIYMVHADMKQRFKNFEIKFKKFHKFQKQHRSRFFNAFMTQKRKNTAVSLCGAELTY